ncbi:MAG: hypothetical protein AB1641_00140 [Thermodesulfobacteriota bacterium]
MKGDEHLSSTIREKSFLFSSRSSIQEARTLVEKWRALGVAQYQAEPSPAGQDPGPVYLAWGNLEILKLPRAAVINSRKPKTNRPGDRWLRITRRLTELARRESMALVASLGERHYELAACAAIENQGPLILVLDGPLPLFTPEEKKIAFQERYGSFIVPGQTVLLSPFLPRRLPPLRSRKLVRDEAVIRLADRLLAAEIRAGGHMERLLTGAIKQNRGIRVYRPDQFDSATRGNRNLLALGAEPWSEPGATVSAGLEQAKKVETGAIQAGTKSSPPELGSYLIHFTRSCLGPWPGQSLFDYYRALIAEEENAGHTAFDALGRILEEGRLRGSGRLIRGQYPVVSFTALGLAGLENLIHWRRTLARWTVEPFGLAIDRRTLFELGARPVVYGDEDTWRRLPGDQRYRFQSRGSAGRDWPREKEWRLAGDLDLKAVPEEKIRVIVPESKETAAVEARYGLKVETLYRPWPQLSPARSRQGRSRPGLP